MSRAGTLQQPDAGPCHRGRAKTLLAYTFERHLTGLGSPPPPGDEPWDVWWVCYRAQRTSTALGVDPGRVRAQRTSTALGVDPGRAMGGCRTCGEQARTMATAAPPAHPDPDGGADGCPCFLQWATSMRRSAPEPDWPLWTLTLAMTKPGTSPGAVRQLLAETHTVLRSYTRELSKADVRRLYPDAYGSDWLARQRDYLTSGPVTVFVLHTNDAAVGHAKAVKHRIRQRLGGGGPLRNHLHMPDSPGDAFADLDHLAGTDVFVRLYGRYERDSAALRLDCYRRSLARAHTAARPG